MQTLNYPAAIYGSRPAWRGGRPHHTLHTAFCDLTTALLRVCTNGNIKPNEEEDSSVCLQLAPKRGLHFLRRGCCSVNVRVFLSPSITAPLHPLPSPALCTWPSTPELGLACATPSILQLSTLQYFATVPLNK